MSRISITRGFAPAILALGIAVSGVAMAQDSPGNAIKYRQTTMKALAEHVGAVAAIAKGDVSQTEHAVIHARAVADIAALMSDLFPDGTGPDSGEKTRTLPAVWQEADKFQQALAVMQDEAAKLVEAAASGDPRAIGAQLGAMGKNGCGTCHTGFRTAN